VSALRDLGRFSEPALFILVSLASGPKHGYAMQDDIAGLTGSRPGPGTLYGAIRRLEELNLVAALPAEERRKPYEITEGGRTALRTELERMRHVATSGLRRLGVTG
jgi:DNA-binding PadR family transcriptional regulator